MRVEWLSSRHTPLQLVGVRDEVMHVPPERVPEGQRPGLIPRLLDCERVRRARDVLQDEAHVVHGEVGRTYGTP